VDHDFEMFPTRILASEATCSLLRGAFISEPLGEVSLKGKEQPLKVQRILRSRTL